MQIEKQFQRKIINYLVENNGFFESKNDNYNTKYGIDWEMLLQFLKNSTKTNKETLNQFQKKYPNEWKNKILEIVNNSLCYSPLNEFLKQKHQNFEFFLNEQKNPEKNIVSVIEELSYEALKTDKDPRLDLVIFINGFPIMTIELKHTQSNHTFFYDNKSYSPNVKAAIAQYRYTRNPNNILFSSRVITNFAMDEYEIEKCDKLEGETSKFIPFNKWKSFPNEPEQTSEFFWKEFLTKQNIIDLIDNWYYQDNKKNNISPRFHQFDATNKVLQDIEKNGIGKTYLFQEAAGSGKTKQQCWLASKLYWIRKFDKIFLLSDRNVLDENMANDLSELSKSLDISGSSSNFVQAMSSSYSDSSLKQQIQTKEHKVICSTIQKFPYIKEVLKILTNKKFAIILDEAHSSTEGEYLRSVKLVKDLANEGKNISIFAFTATPKQSTLELFGSFNEQKNIKQPFYLYSHKQAISEEMIIDVLNNEIKTVKRSEKLNEPEIDKIFEDRTQAAIKLREEINNRDDILRKECEYDLDLFFEKVEPLLNHTAKAMFISSSRKNAQKRAYILNQILAERGKNIKVLAGFSGILDKEELEEEEIERINTNEQEDEIKLSKQLTNDERIKDIGETFKYGIKLGNNKYDNSFRILVCANKFQTGFDVPSLCGLFVHRKMTSSVNAFQTYNRLNRNYSFKTDDGIIYKKEKTFILDWRNSIEFISNSFTEFNGENNIDKNKLTNKELLLQECEKILIKLNLNTRLDDIIKYFKNEFTDFNSYKKMRDNIIELDNYCNQIENLKEEFKYERIKLLKKYKENYQWLLNLEEKDEYSSGKNIDFYKNYCFIKIVINCSRFNSYDKPDFKDLIKIYTISIEEKEKKTKKDDNIIVLNLNDEKPKNYDKKISLKKLIEEYNSSFLNQNDKVKMVDIIYEIIEKCSKDEELKKRAKNNDFIKWRGEFIEKISDDLNNEDDFYSMEKKELFIKDLAESCGSEIYSKLRKNDENIKE